MPANRPATRNLDHPQPSQYVVARGEEPPTVDGIDRTSGHVQYGEAIRALHERCGVYTRPNIVGRILDMVGWVGTQDLSDARLLEPAVGGGEFVVQAAERLIESLRALGIEPKIDHLRSRIVGFEIYAQASAAARRRVVKKLASMGIHNQTARACAKAWIRTGDYLLSEEAEQEYTHVVGNPPYVRWHKIPRQLRLAYEGRSPAMARGDLYLPFLDRTLDELKAGGRCGFVCSDRWQYAAYATDFRRKWLASLEVDTNRPVEAADAFTRDVSAYANLLVASKRDRSEGLGCGVVTRPRKGRTLAELGCTIRVGPALGVTSAFVVNDEHVDVEPELLMPWLDAAEVREGRVAWRGRFVISMFNVRGELQDLATYPRLAEHLEKYRANLTERYIVRRGAPWYRTIDRLVGVDWVRPKILVPDIAKKPRAALDRRGFVPSHGVYAIFAPAGQLERVYDALRDGGLADGLEGIAPRIKGGYSRCYKRFLSEIRV